MRTAFRGQVRLVRFHPGCLSDDGQVDMLGKRYKFVNFRAKKKLVGETKQERKGRRRAAVVD